jgi:hypothetical protein
VYVVLKRTDNSVANYLKLWANPSHPGRKIHQLIGARVAENAWDSVFI